MMYNKSRRAVCAIGNKVFYSKLLNYTRWRCNVNGLSHDEGWTKLAENLRASPLNKDLSKDTTYNQIHLYGQYL